jgi:hypothetical protein
MNQPDPHTDIGRIADALELLAIEVSQIRALLEAGEDEDVGRPLSTPIEVFVEPKGN